MLGSRRRYGIEGRDEAFQVGRLIAARGSPGAPICGARTRTGTLCQQLPIREGKGRCLGHAGPHAARLHREAQRKAFLSGKISAEDWERAEARRAANRLGWDWKKNPWLPGRTIDLGPAEGTLRADMTARGLDVEALPPAVADWLRWRWRRTQIDRKSDRAWHRVVTEALPGRIARAGPRPSGIAEVSASVNARTWKLNADSSVPEVTSKRTRADVPRAPKLIRGKGYARPGRPRTQPPREDEVEGLMSVYRAHRATVGPMLARCRSEGERMAVLRALRDFLADPSDRAPREQWLGWVQVLRVT